MARPPLFHLWKPREGTFCGLATQDAVDPATLHRTAPGVWEQRIQGAPQCTLAAEELCRECLKASGLERGR